MGKGKKVGKIAFMAAGFFLGAGGAGQALFGLKGASFAAGMYGMSIASTIWSVTQKPNAFGNLDGDYSQDDYSKFSTTTNDISQDAVIPVIYGTRKWGGLQVWHNPYNGERYLQKDVIVCEGGIKGVYNVCANEELIKNDTNISIYNIQHQDAVVYRSGNTLYLQAGGKTDTYALKDVESQDQQAALLSTVIEKIRNECGNGWKIDGAVDDRTSKGINAKNMQFNSSAAVGCYCDPADPARSNMVVLDNRGYAIGSFVFNDCVAPDNFQDVGGYTNTAWIRTDLVASGRLSGGNPTVNCIVQGQRVKVWKDSAWVSEYSENPSWIIRDFLTNKRYGTGHWIAEDMIDDDSFKDVAAYCDEEVEYLDAEGVKQKAPRYKLNIILDAQKTPIEQLSSMLAVGGLFLTLNRQIALRVEKEETPCYAFDDTTIIKDSLSITQTSLEETPNRYKIGYFDPSQNWTEIKVVVEDLEAQLEQDGRIIEKTITLAGCTSQNQALRVARLYRDLNKTCSISVSFSVATQGMSLECGDVITVSYGGIFSKMPFRITEIDETNAGTYQLTCRQYNPSIYNDELGAPIVMPDYTNSKPPYTTTPPSVTGLTVEENSWTSAEGILQMGMDITWDDMYYAYLDHYSVSLSRDGKSYKTYSSTFDTSATLAGLQQGSYWVSVQAVSRDGVKGAPAIKLAEIAGKDRPPPDVALLDAELLPDGTRRFWWNFGYPKVNDIAGFKIKYTQGSNPQWQTAFELHSGVITSQPFETQALRQGVHTVMIKAVDNGGNESVNAAYAVLNLGDPLEENVLWKVDLAENNWEKVEHDGVVENGVLKGKSINDELLVLSHLQPLAGGQLWLEYGLNSPSTVKYCLGSGSLAWSKPQEMAWGEALNSYWRFSGIFKPYTGKIVINATDSLHLEVHSLPEADTRAEIAKLNAIIDVPDRVENFSNLLIPAEGLTLPIKTPYYYTTSVRINAIQSVVSVANVKIITRNPCKIQIIDAEGKPIEAVCDLTWQGFRRELV